MTSISISYTLVYQLKGHPNYKMSKCGLMFNMKTGRKLKKCYNSGSIGYWINKKFIAIKKDGSSRILEKIPRETTLF